MKQNIKQFHTIENYWTTPGWLGKRMLFLSGPRQVGKTTLVQSKLCTQPKAYFNWDARQVRIAFQKNPEFFAGTTAKWICFDEIHKRPKWKDILKGIYDVYKDQYRFVITGSARLDTFKKSGDSLVGRYFHTQLFPLNLPDFVKNDFQLPKQPENLIKWSQDLKDARELDDLLQLGGFPEPFFSGRESFWNRWSQNHTDLILTEDLRDLTRVIEVDKIETLLEMMQPSIGQLISNHRLAQDLETTHNSIKRWLQILNKLQLIFSVSPYSNHIRKAYKKEKKWYFMDWKKSENNLFENYIACSLYRAVRLYNDRFGEKMSLHFIRTHNGTEVDFLICRHKKPWLLIEVKEGQPEVSKAIHRFTEEFNIPCFIVTKKKNIFKKEKGKRIYAISWSKFGQVLP